MADQSFENLPDSWGVQELQDVASTKIVYGIVQAGPHVDGGIPYIKSSNVGGDINVDELQCTSDKIAEKYSRSKVTPGDIVFSLRGNIGETSIVPECLPVANLTQGTARISTPDSVSSSYLRHQLRNPSVLKRILAVAKGSTFVEISLADLRKIKVPIAPSDEQFEIESLFGVWDSAISAVERLIANCKCQKKALTQQLLTGKRRLPGFDVEWAEVAFGSIFSPSKLKNSDNEEFDVLSVTKGGVVFQRDHFKKEVASDDKSDYLIVKRGDLVMSGLNFWMGSIDYQHICDRGLVSPAYKVFETNECLVDANFMRFFVRSAPMLRILVRSSIQGASVVRRNLDMAGLVSSKLLLPSRDEQKEIAQVLIAADNEFSNVQCQLDLLEEQKKALMQQLLTGKRRVKVDEEAA